MRPLPFHAQRTTNATLQSNKTCTVRLGDLTFIWYTHLVNIKESLPLWIGCSPCMQVVEGSTPTGGTSPNDFSDRIDRDIRTQWALSWKIVVSEWRSVIAVSLNDGGGVRLIKPAKLYTCTQKHYKHNEDGRTAPGVCGNGSVPLSHSGNVVTKIGIHTHCHHKHIRTSLSCSHNKYLNSTNILIGK